MASSNNKRFSLTSNLDSKTLQELVNSGKSYSDVARMYGVASQSVSELAAKWEVVLPPTDTDTLSANHDVVSRLVAEGKTARVIGDRLGVAVDSVRRYIRINRIERPIEKCPFDENLLDSGLNWREISRQFGISINVVSSWAAKLGKTSPKVSKYQDIDQEIVSDWRKNFTITQIANNHNLSAPFVSSILTKAGINTTSRVRLIPHTREVLNDFEKLSELRSIHSVNELADILGCHPDTVLKRSIELGVRYSSPVDRIPELSDPILLQEMIEKYSLENIADQLGCSHPVVSQQLDLFGIKRRGRSTSSHEWLVRGWLDEASIPYEFSNRTILNGMEIDIVVKDRPISFEINGCYWHSEKFRDKHYHLKKKQDASNQGLHLIHLYENDLNKSPNLMKSKILSLFRKPEIYARKCKLVHDVPYVDFLNDNHIQGAVHHTFNVGLEYEGRVVAICCFTKRLDKFELIRYATVDEGVVGGFSKIINSTNCGFYTYADLNWTNFRKNMYEKSGLKFIHQTTPDYSYYDRSTKDLVNRRSMTRDALKRRFGDKFVEELTEHDNATNLGFLKLWDCGKLKYEKET